MHKENFSLTILNNRGNFHIHEKRQWHFDFKLDFIFYLVWPLKAIFLFSSNKLVPKKYWSIRSMQNTSNEVFVNTSNEVFVLCKIIITVEHTSTKQDLEIT